MTDRYAGDNYRIEASLDSAIVTDPFYECATGCFRSGIITAWKRVYLERARTFRAGAFVVQRADAGQNEVHVSDRSNFRANQSVRLIHAPPLFGGVGAFYYEDVMVDDVQRVRGNNDQRILVLQAPLRYTYNVDPSFPGLQHLADAVGIPSDGYFERNEFLLTRPFADAFVEYVDAPTAIPADLPYVPFISNPAYLQLANKWFQNSPALGTSRPGNPNVKHVLGGSGLPEGRRNPRGVDPFSLGVTGSVATGGGDLFPNFSWTWVGGIERGVRVQSVIRNFDDWTVNGENVVHELAHAWDVNRTTSVDGFGHCDKSMALSLTICSLNPANETQLGDATVGFHWVSRSNSEYVDIRSQFEPVPIP